MKKIINRLGVTLNYNSHITQRSLKLLGILGTLSHSFYWFFWTQVNKQHYEQLSIRIVGALSCMLLLTVKYWPTFLKKLSPLYLFIAVGYNVPFYYTTYFILSGLSPFRAIGEVTMIFIVIILLPNFVLLAVNLILSVLASALYVYWLFPTTYASIDTHRLLDTYFPFFVFAGVVGFLLLNRLC